MNKYNSKTNTKKITKRQSNNNSKTNIKKSNNTSLKNKERQTTKKNILQLINVDLKIPPIPPDSYGKKKGKFYDLFGLPELSKDECTSLLNSIELSIHTKGIEHVAVLNKKGVYYTNTGDDEKCTIDGKIKGTQFILTHNHPNIFEHPNLLSGADLYVLLHKNIFAIRAVSFGKIYQAKKGTCSKSARWIKRNYDRLIKKVIKDTRKQIPKFKSIKGEPKYLYNQRAIEYNCKLDKAIFLNAEIEAKKFCEEHGILFSVEELK